MRNENLWETLKEEARSQDHSYIGVEHLFSFLVKKRGGRAEQMLEALCLRPADVGNIVLSEVGKGGGSGNGEAKPTPRLRAVFERAESFTDEDLLTAMIEEGQSLPVRYLHSLGFDSFKLLSALCADFPRTLEATPDQTRIGSFDSMNTVHTSLPPASKGFPTHGPAIRPEVGTPIGVPTPTLDKFGRDLTRKARLGDLNDAIGRDDEIEKVLTILARTQKSNPILLGDAGVGKTAVVEGLAWRMTHGLVPAILRGKRIIELDSASLKAGTSLRGQLEERIKALLEEAAACKEVILFIDEIHTLVDSGDSSGDQTAQLFKPSLARGDLSCIGVTTQDEYARFIRKDPALERRFSPVVIEELSSEATLIVLEKVSRKMIRKHVSAGNQLVLSKGAYNAAVELTDRYVKDRNQPDKAIDVLDTAVARAVIKGKDFVDTDDIAQVVSAWTGIPMGHLNRDDRDKYNKMEESLSSHVIGQPAAIKAVSRAIRASMSGMKAPNRPVGVFLFLGPSGVGKTKLAKELSGLLFGTIDALVRIDMSEYQEKHSISNLIGASRGYIGSDRGGLLTEALRRRPFCVVLLDEIEKAHPEIFNIFLSVFDDGRLTDNTGRNIDCSNAIFILTSNLGAQEFLRSESVQDLRGLASRFLRPELVNRISEVIAFAPLGKRTLARILDVIITEKADDFQRNHQLQIIVENDAKATILSESCEPNQGARQLERAVEFLLVHPLVDALFSRQIEPGTTVFVRSEDNKLVFQSKGT